MEIKIGAEIYGDSGTFHCNRAAFDFNNFYRKNRRVVIDVIPRTTVMFQSKVNGEDMVCLPYPESRKAERVFKTTIGQINKGKVYDRSFGGSPHLIYLFEKYEKMGDMKTYEIKNRLF